MKLRSFFSLLAACLVVALPFITWMWAKSLEEGRTTARGLGDIGFGLELPGPPSRDG